MYIDKQCASFLYYLQIISIKKKIKGQWMVLPLIMICPGISQQ